MKAGGASRVFFILLAAEVPPRAPLPGPVFVRLLGDLGLSEGAARSVILRLRQAGWLTSVRAGRVVGYAPSAAALARLRRHAKEPTAAGPAWDGSFHAIVIRVPERRRSFRDGLRRVAAIAGYRSLRPGLLIAPSDRRAEIAPALDQTPTDASVLFAQLRLSVKDSRGVAAALWDLDELADRYRALALAARNAAVTARRCPPIGPAALRALATVNLPIFEAFGDDPDLPPELLPSAWPELELRSALSDLLDRLAPEVDSYIERLRIDHASNRNRARERQIGGGAVSRTGIEAPAKK